ncbi:MAG: di-trans,poly-cis-decaprenylcistransferase [Gammaproteobacteria bacterium RIFCSPLOWO2_02_FULL_42_14]|nr:MAG: di-trans,poly-cis-decaprenylcistransferase [Gammaproteobacteria bacterium RIFCSPHIGHO2_02_FULL_42_43]OGT27430.1 MAG: di-trans,poly-cis-decaprenylcistransferase [Gammaproteobacteria bacterium RIFCSPHIGHO2_01_FULL_42_8]OGT52361.1 MAG: di-trans,poly-cis-decaprenylcistransferase [Gammaproteobacteria bacterium RIFCSPHIGHO2_12_FULL_41_25]OGT63349.1 MAG: di-trans,poly-cis-decaprenylcistransferase [Gammaproteobacteria bacterium RIFCSPLOWO2_02_FULL_42_14]OGT86316.1 MAG: di-trans,poly-cis-decapre
MNSEFLKIPKHVAIVMDGNGRWAKKRLLPRMAGHRAGAKSVRRAVTFCEKQGISVLSLYALSIENFHSRPNTEVSFLTSLLFEMIEQNIDELHEENVCVRVMGDLSVFPTEIQARFYEAQTRTQHNTKLTFVLAIHYSGRWDILQAAKQLSHAVSQHQLDLDSVTEETLAKFICISDLPEPDLLIRTSGEQRISNFMLWQTAYTEFYFTDVLWPDFDEAVFMDAIRSFQQRERRFGLTSEQVSV